MPVTWMITATMAIGTDIGSMIMTNICQKPAPSTRAALNSSIGSAPKKLRKSSVRIGMPKMV